MSPVLILLVILTGIGLAFAVIVKLVRRPPVPCHMYIGKPGAGKSTLMVKLILKDIKRGRTVACNDKQIAERLGVLYIPSQRIPYDCPDDCSLYLDEAGIDFDNRQFKNFSTDLRDFFKLHRHKNVNISLFSQQYDIDKKIRDICDGFSIVRPFFGLWLFERRVDIVIRMISAEKTADAVARIVDDLQKRNLLSGGIRIHFAPRYWRKFDSYDTSLLDAKKDKK